MADKTAIEWTDATWNPVRGCTRISEGCRNCYAERVAARFSGPGQAYEGFADRARPGSAWTGMVGLRPEQLAQPLRWTRGRRIFVNSMSDLFHEALSFEDIDAVMGIIALSPHHAFQVLTKRALRMREYFARPRPRGFLAEVVAAALVKGAPDVAKHAPLDRQRADALAAASGGAQPLPNLWLGVSVENQAAADERIPDLLAAPAAVRFLSCEPLLGPVSLRSHWLRYAHPFAKSHPDAYPDRRVDWVIAGGESGLGARPMHPDWVRGLRDQCAAAGVPFFFKQWGEWAPVGHVDRGTATDPAEFAWERVGKGRAGALLDGREHREFPAARSGA